MVVLDSRQLLDVLQRQRMEPIRSAVRAADDGDAIEWYDTLTKISLDLVFVEVKAGRRNQSTYDFIGHSPSIDGTHDVQSPLGSCQRRHALQRKVFLKFVFKMWLLIICKYIFPRRQQSLHLRIFFGESTPRPASGLDWLHNGAGFILGTCWFVAIGAANRCAF